GQPSQCLLLDVGQLQLDAVGQPYPRARDGKSLWTNRRSPLHLQLHKCRCRLLQNSPTAQCHRPVIQCLKIQVVLLGIFRVRQLLMFCSLYVITPEPLLAGQCLFHFSYPRWKCRGYLWRDRLSWLGGGLSTAYVCILIFVMNWEVNPTRWAIS